MRNLGISGALVVVAFSALVVTEASANVWLENGVAIKETHAANTHGTFELHNIVIGSEVTVLCSRLFVATVSPEGRALISEMKNLSGTETNLVACESHTPSVCGGKVLLHAENVPWTFQLLATTPIRGDFSEDGKGGPAWLLLCETGIHKEILCTKNIVAIFIGNGASGARFEYTKESTETTCSNGLKGWLTGTGEVLGFTLS